jgi:acyl-CoA thioesterase
MSPRDILYTMFENDPFSKWLGIQPVNVGVGYCTLQLTVRNDMLNGFGMAHGGISFSLADSAFAFACNSHGRQAVSIHCTIEHVAPVFEGDVLTAQAQEDHLGNKISNYSILVTNQDQKTIALFRGVAFRKEKEW